MIIDLQCLIFLWAAEGKMENTIQVVAWAYKINLETPYKNTPKFAI